MGKWARSCTPRGWSIVRDCLVHIDDFWRIVAEARADAGATHGLFDKKTVADALTERLAALSTDGILDFVERFEELSSHLDSWEMCAACYLISGYISDDAFADFKAGIVALGREAYERAVDDPDSLADNSIIEDIATGRVARTGLFAESFMYAPSYAYKRLSDGDGERYWEARATRDEAAGPRQPSVRDWDGRFGAPGDRERIPERVPRLSTLFPLQPRESEA